MKGSHHILTTKLIVSKDEWDTKEDTGKSMKNALYTLRYAKATLNSKPIAPAIVE